MKSNQFLIPLLTIAVALMTTYLTHAGNSKWYKELKFPFLWIWYVVYAFTAVALIVAWNSDWYLSEELLSFGIFIMINAMMNVFWSFLIFYMKALGLALIESIGLLISTASLVIFAYPASKLAAMLLAPYALWILFLIYFSYSVWNANKSKQVA